MNTLNRPTTTAFCLAIALIAVFAATINASDTTEPIPAASIPDSAVSQLLSSELKPDEALVWYLFHTGYAVKTKSKLLLFDYTRGLWRNQSEPDTRSLSNGWINPAEIKALDVYVFVSHPHRDHFDSTIYGWRDSVRSVTYFFGWDETKGDRVHNMVGPRATYKDDKIQVWTINSHHSGVPEVAYLVKTDSLCIYHGGDYNADYAADYPYLGTFVPRLDIAMMNDWCGDPIFAVIDQFKPRLVLPGHFGARETEPKKLPACLASRNPEIRVGDPKARGQLFRYRR